MVLNGNNRREIWPRDSHYFLFIYATRVPTKFYCTKYICRTRLSSRIKLSFSLCSNVVFIINSLWYMKLLKISAIFGPFCLLADAMLLLMLCIYIYVINRISICLKNLKVVAMEFYNIMYFCATFESLDPFTKLGELLTELTTRARSFWYIKKSQYILHILSLLSIIEFRHQVSLFLYLSFSCKAIINI